MNSNVLRFGAIVLAGLIFCTTITAIVVLAVAGKIDGTNSSLIVSMVGIDATAIPALLTFALASQIHGLVNGNSSTVLQALADVAKANPGRRESDIATQALTQSKTPGAAVPPSPPPAPSPPAAA